ncbi:hypothetical protein LTS15_006202 [Exophiala xenobiotica]|nr:hypothetical protein LTS15_006202 [Exophiala xenobiotica]
MPAGATFRLNVWLRHRQTGKKILDILLQSYLSVSLRYLILHTLTERTNTMGGLAFKEVGLSTPRMPPPVYYHVMNRMQTLLRSHFNFVGSPIEAPAKTSHGDIDILVAEPVNKSRGITRDFLAGVLDAKKTKAARGTSSSMFAVPWPKEFDNEIAADPQVSPTAACLRSAAGKGTEGAEPTSEEEQKPATPSAQPGTTALNTPPPMSSAEKYIQVDIHICANEAFYNWHLFYEAHGDLWNMLGGIIRPFGLTCAQNGLLLRIEEVEAYNKIESRVKMTDDPARVLDYLGLDSNKYWTPFTSWDDMMAYASTCRFHDPGRWRRRDKKGGEEEEQVDVTEERKVADCLEKVDGDLTEDDPTKLKHNDRARAAKRPAFHYWINTYLPAHVNDTPGKDARMTRQQVIEDAKMYFGDQFASQFENRKTKWTRQIKVDKMWSELRKSLPVQGSEIGYVMKGMKREVTSKQHEEDTVEGLATAIADVRKAYQENRLEDVLAWAKIHWEEVGERQKKFEAEKERMRLSSQRAPRTAGRD